MTEAGYETRRLDWIHRLEVGPADDVYKRDFKRDGH